MTIRGLLEKVRRTLRESARDKERSLNPVGLEALQRGLGPMDEIVEYHDLDDLAGTWVDDPDFDRVIAEMRVPESEVWT